jgi:hypothetical protein
MNKRIQKMYEAARVAAGQEHQFETTNLDVAEKFAELIVKECADIAQEHNKSPVKSIYAVGHVIREHFGVES